MVNSIVLVGRVIDGPSAVEQSQAARFKLRVVRPSKEQDQHDDFAVELTGKQAQLALDYLRKGELVGVQGRCQIQSNSSLLVLASNIRLLGKTQQTDTSESA